MFFGAAVSATTLPRFSDIYGRKLIYLFSIVLQMIVFIGLFFSHNIDLTSALMFFFGIAAVGRCSIGFLLLMEFLPTK
jgi:MFS family permease